MNTGQFRVRKRTQKGCTLAFKLQVVEEVESGQLSQDAAQRKYGIQENATILVWLRTSPPPTANTGSESILTRFKS
jgi:hypothetical protein